MIGKMKLLYTLIILMMVGTIFGQMKLNYNEMSDFEKIYIYESEKKSPILGIAFSLVLPSSGHAYAGNWKRGLLFKSAEISAFSLSLITSEIAWENGTCPNGYVKDDYECYNTNENYVDVEPTYLNKVSMVLMASVPVLIIWEFVDVMKSVKKYNHNIFREIFGEEPPSFSLNLQPAYNGANLTLSYNIK